jgi:hypothetical protein
MIDRKGVEPLGPDSPVLQLNGVPTPLADGVAGDCFLQTSEGSWRPLEDDGLYSVEAECVALHDDLAASIFGGLDVYWKLLPHVPPFLSQAGLNSEAPIGREDFEKALAKLAAFPELNRFLYLYDCRVLVSAIQECTKEVSQLTGEFYRILNLEPFFTPGIPVEDSVRWSTSPTVTMLFSTLGFLFIRMHSLLDYLAKLACEIESIRTDFETYPRLASSSFLFGDRKRLKKLAREKVAGTLFETCDEVVEVELIRNLLIHDGLLDDMPKAYEAIEGGKAIERFVLMPDRRDGKFERFKNRHRFYGREDKINLRLTMLVRGFQARQVETLKAIRSLIARG